MNISVAKSIYKLLTQHTTLLTLRDPGTKTQCNPQVQFKIMVYIHSTNGVLNFILCICAVEVRGKLLEM